MKKLFWFCLVAFLLIATISCAPIRADVYDAQYSPWYSYCTWYYPCEYSNDVIFVYGYGWFPRRRYIYYYYHPEYRKEIKHFEVPRNRPIRHEEFHERGRKH